MFNSNRVVVVAEAGSNHGGNLQTALDLIHAAKDAGADVVKFQLFTAEGLAHPNSPAYTTLQKYALPREWLPRLKQEANEVGIGFTATPFDLEAIDLLDELGVPFIKIASGDLTYHDLIRKAVSTGRPLVISTGAAKQKEVTAAANAICDSTDRALEDVCWMQCAMMYPARLDQQRMRWLVWATEWDDKQVGFSDHTLSVVLPAVAVGMGACMIEKHFTLSRNQEGPDHPHSLEPPEFKQMVAYIREAETARGSSAKAPLPEEIPMRTTARRGWYAVRDLPVGHVLQLGDVVALRPAVGGGADMVVVGRTLVAATKAMAPVMPESLR